MRVAVLLLALVAIATFANAHNDPLPLKHKWLK